MGVEYGYSREGDESVLLKESGTVVSVGDVVVDLKEETRKKVSGFEISNGRVLYNTVESKSNQSRMGLLAVWDVRFRTGTLEFES